MIEIIKETIVFISPLIAGFITSVVIPLIVKRSSIKSLQKRIDEVQPIKETQEIKRELADIKKEILQMRGKIK